MVLPTIEEYAYFDLQILLVIGSQVLVIIGINSVPFKTWESTKLPKPVWLSANLPRKNCLNL